MIVKRQLMWIGLAVCLAGGEVLAQQGAVLAGEGAAGHKSVRIREVTGLGRNALFRTPQYNSAGGMVAKMPATDWVQISVLFAAPPDRDVWLDDLGVQFYVLLYNRLHDEYSLLRNSQQLFDVGPARGRQSTM